MVSLMSYDVGKKRVDNELLSSIIPFSVITKKNRSLATVSGNTSETTNNSFLVSDHGGRGLKRQLVRPLYPVLDVVVRS